MEKPLPFVYLSIGDVCAAYGKCGRSSLYAKIKTGDFPAPDKDGKRSLWRSDVVAKWLEDRAAQAAAGRDEQTRIARAKAQRMVNARAKRQTQAA